MLRQLAFGIAICLVNIAIHAALMAAVVAVAQRVSSATERLHERRRMMAIMVSTVSVLMVAHTIEVAVWAAAYRLIDLAPADQAFYFAFVNYTTLGYGELLPPAEWRLIGPITAMNGVLLFGWSTAVIFEVLRTCAGALRDLPTHSAS
jgi:ion channel